MPDVSSMEKEINRIQDEQNVSYVGPLAGWPIGIHKHSDDRFLVTKAAMPLTTKDIKWKSISVVNEEVLKLEWYPVLHSQKFQLFSNTKKDTVFKGAQNLAYDTVSHLSKAIYTYQLAAHDVCGRVITSEKANNVLLSGKNFGNDFAKLTWNNPNLWDQTGTYYQLNQTNNLGYELNNLFNSDMLEFLDYNFLQNDSINKCYRIKAYHVDSLYPSLSNVLCLPYDVVFYVPDAFSPNGDGLNDVFKVEGLGILPNNYRMEIYNRWGQLVFASDDINHNWDGGNEVSGIYVYLIKIRGKQNNIEKQFNLKGNVMLLR
jgi:gliding motility-associated-like protein